MTCACKSVVWHCLRIFSIHWDHEDNIMLMFQVKEDEPRQSIHPISIPLDWTGKMNRTKHKFLPFTKRLPLLLATPNWFLATHVYRPASIFETLDIRRLPLSNTVTLWETIHTQTQTRTNYNPAILQGVSPSDRWQHRFCLKEMKLKFSPACGNVQTNEPAILKHFKIGPGVYLSPF